MVTGKKIDKIQHKLRIKTFRKQEGKEVSQLDIENLKR